MNGKESKLISVFMAAGVIVGLVLLFVAPTTFALQSTTGGTGSQHVGLWVKQINDTATSSGSSETSCQEAELSAGLDAYDTCVADLQSKCEAGGGTMGTPHFSVIYSESTPQSDGSCTAEVAIHCWGGCVYKGNE